MSDPRAVPKDSRSAEQHAAALQAQLDELTRSYERLRRKYEGRADG